MLFQAAATLLLLPAVAFCAEGGKTVIDGQTYELVTSTLDHAQVSNTSPSTAATPTTSTPPFTSPPAVTTTTSGLNNTTNSTTSSSAASSSVKAGATQTIKVGTGGNIFSPDNIVAEVGATIEYQFVGPGQFSVAQSNYDSPCEYSNGLYSGIFDTTGDGANASVFRVSVADTNPMWLFCGTGSLCKSGMAAVINPPANQSLAGYKDAASKAAATPITKTDAVGGDVVNANSNSTTSSPTPSSSSSTTTSKSSSTKSTSSSASASSTGAHSEGTFAKVPMAYTSLLLAIVVAAGFGTLL